MSVVNKPGVLSQETLEEVASIIHQEAINQRDSIFQKRALTECHSTKFCPLNAFKRIDFAGKGFINSLDLVNLFRQNNKVLPEGDAYMLISAFDSNMDGKLSLIDFQKMVCPMGYNSLQHNRATKREFSYAVDNSLMTLSFEIEHAIIRICEKEIQCVKDVEKQKQSLMSREDYSMLEIFRHIDQFAHGTINADNLRVFFKSFSFCSELEEEDIINWLRRYDRDVDQRLDFSDFVTALGPLCNYNQKAKPEPEKEVTVEDEMEANSDMMIAPPEAQRRTLRKKGIQSSTNSLSKMTKTTAVSLNHTTKDIMPARLGRNNLKTA